MNAFENFKRNIYFTYNSKIILILKFLIHYLTFEIVLSDDRTLENLELSVLSLYIKL